MSYDEVKTIMEKKLINLVQDMYDEKKLSEKTNLVAAYNLDSLMFVQLLVEIENTFEILINLEEIDYSQLCIYGYLLKYVFYKIHENKEV